MGLFMMREIDLTALLIIPAGLAVAFMLWVLWNFHKEARKPSSSHVTASLRTTPNYGARDARGSGMADFPPPPQSDRSSILPHIAGRRGVPL
jgi:hypothetical protein